MQGGQVQGVTGCWISGAGGDYVSVGFLVYGGLLGVGCPSGFAAVCLRCYNSVTLKGGESVNFCRYYKSNICSCVYK